MARCGNGLEYRADEDLVSAAVIGDLKAYDELVRRFRPAVRIVARETTGGAGYADDVVQEAFLAAYKALPKLRNPARFGPWLCAITRNLAKRTAASEGRYQPLADVDRVIIANSRELAWDPHAFDERDERAARVRAELNGMAREYADVIGLFHLESWPIGRIADFLDLPITTVKWRLHIGRKLLRRQLKEHTE